MDACRANDYHGLTEWTTTRRRSVANRCLMTQAPIRRHGAVAIVQQSDRLLVIRRSLTVTAPGAYCFPGGGIEPGETEPEALVREFREELGAELSPVRRVWHSITPWRVDLSWWLGYLPADAELRANPTEVSEFAWYTPGEMARLPGLLTSNHAFLAALAAGEIQLD